MREAVRESYRHDNFVEGLEWARAILAGSVVPHATPRKSNFLQNFPTPVSGYVPRNDKKSWDSRQDDSTSSTVNRLYGFTPSRQLGTRPIMPPSETTPTALSSRSPHKNGHTMPRDHCVSAEVQRRLPTRRRRNLSQVLVTPVKVDGLGARSLDTETLRNSHSRQLGSSTPTPDILGEMCKGLEVLENRSHTIRRDGSIVPKGNDGSVTQPQDDKDSPHLSPSSTVDRGKKRDISEGVGAKKNSRTCPSNKSLSSDTSSKRSLAASDGMSSSAGSSVSPDKLNRQESVDVKCRVHAIHAKCSDDPLKDGNAKKKSLGASKCTGNRAGSNHSDDPLKDGSGKKKTGKCTSNGASVSGTGKVGSQSPITSQPKKLCGYTIPKLSCPTPLLPTPIPRSTLLETPTPPPTCNNPTRRHPKRSSALSRRTRANKKRSRVKSVESDRPQLLVCGKRRRGSASSLLSSESSTTLPFRQSKPSTDSTRSSQPISLMEIKCDYVDARTDIPEAGGSKLEQPATPKLDALRNAVGTPKLDSKLDSQETDSKAGNQTASGHDPDVVLIPNGIHNAPKTDPSATLPYDPEDKFDAFYPAGDATTTERSVVNTEAISPSSDEHSQFNLSTPLLSSTHPASGHSSPAQVDPKTVIRRTLDRYFDKGTITNRQYKRILERASRKVQQGFEKIPIVDENKVKKLVSDFVHAYKTEAPFLALK